MKNSSSDGLRTIAFPLQPRSLEHFENIPVIETTASPPLPRSPSGRALAIPCPSHGRQVCPAHWPGRCSRSNTHPGQSSWKTTATRGRGCRSVPGGWGRHRSLPSLGTSFTPGPFLGSNQGASRSTAIFTVFKTSVSFSGLEKMLENTLPPKFNETRLEFFKRNIY